MYRNGFPPARLDGDGNCTGYRDRDRDGVRSPSARRVVTVPTAEPATPVAFQYGPNGAYAVGQARGGLTQVIAPGRYRVEGVNGSGFLKQCDSVICDMTGTEHVVDTTITQSGVPTILDIPGSASVVAVYLFDTTATPLE